MTDAAYLNISKTLSHSRANGPGIRSVIWVQGCTIGCDGCYSVATHPHRKINIVPPEELAIWICSLDGIEGVSISGGEPFEQAHAVNRLLQCIRAERPDLSVFVFTGYEFEFLQQATDTDVQALLAQIDLLCCGPFDPEKHDINLLWRGSSNQRLIYLSNRYSADEERVWVSDSPVEEVLMADSALEYTGFKGNNGIIYNHLRNPNLIQ